MSNDFYHFFESKHRGSRDLIKSRLVSYAPFLHALVEVYPEGNIVDLGCGRGEWLEYVTETTPYQCHGVDLDKDMLADCEKAGLSHECKDAISHLQQLEDNSQVLVSAFHLVEHLPFSQLLMLVEEAHRVLKPAGLLILETPNPENIVVGTSQFYMDPTHEKPIPPHLLAFITDYLQFERSKIARVNEKEEIYSSEQITLFDVLKRSSPDYAVIAQKQDDKQHLKSFDACFDKTYGETTENLAARFEQRTKQTETKVAAIEQQSQKLLEKFQQANAQNEVLLHQITQMTNSTSWRITAPLRTVAARLKAVLKK